MRRFAIVAALVLATSWTGAAMLRRLVAVRAEERALVARSRPPGPARTGDAVAIVRAVVVPGVAVRVSPQEGGRARVTVVGPERTVLHLIARIETGRPAVRFLPWRLEPAPGTADGVRFDGVAMAATR